MKPFKHTIDQIFSNEGVGYSETNSNQLILDACYHCGRPKKMYVNPNTGLYMCFRCEEKGGPVKLLMEVLNCTYEESIAHLYGADGEGSIYDDDDEDFFNRQKKQTELPQPIVTEAYLHRLEPSDTDAWNYLINRGLDEETINKMNVLHNAFSKRIIFTVSHDGKLYGTLARDYTGTQMPKVLNSKGKWRSFFVWNFDSVKNSDYIVICEGVMSAAKCGLDHAIATLGKFVSDEQIKLIRQTKAKKIYMCLDVGTDKEQNSLFDRLQLFYNNAIYKIDLPHVMLGKGVMGKDGICAKMNQVFKTNLHYNPADQTPTANTYYFNYVDKTKAIDACKINHLMDKEEKEVCIKRFLNKSGVHFSQAELKEAIDLLLYCEYKDAGDYTFAEMQGFIAKATLFEKEDF